jgi:hypothetical protein
MVLIRFLLLYEAAQDELQNLLPFLIGPEQLVHDKSGISIFLWYDVI